LWQNHINKKSEETLAEIIAYQKWQKIKVVKVGCTFFYNEIFLE